jgi:hypothetical protein
MFKCNGTLSNHVNEKVILLYDIEIMNFIALQSFVYQKDIQYIFKLEISPKVLNHQKTRQCA